MICEECRAALALQNRRPQWLEVAFDDADLRRVVEAWDQLSSSVRSTIALFGEACSAPRLMCLSR